MGDSLQVGITEKEIAGIAEKVMRDRGSQFAWTFNGGKDFASGCRTWWFWGGCTPATDKIVQYGDPVMIDLHGMFWLMLGDVAHNAIMGSPRGSSRRSSMPTRPSAARWWRRCSPEGRWARWPRR